jgi:hypothetical protein
MQAEARVMRSLLIAVLLIASTVPVAAQTPSSTTLPVLPMPRVSATPHVHLTPRPTAVSTFTNPGSKHAHVLTPAGGSSCTRNAIAAQQRVNPITGQPQAGTLVSVPIGNNAGTLASATNHQQQIDACAHGH